MSVLDKKREKIALEIFSVYCSNIRDSFFYTLSSIQHISESMQIMMTSERNVEYVCCEVQLLYGAAAASSLFHVEAGQGGFLWSEKVLNDAVLLSVC